MQVVRRKELEWGKKKIFNVPVNLLQMNMTFSYDQEKDTFQFKQLNRILWLISDKHLKLFHVGVRTIATGVLTLSCHLETNKVLYWKNVYWAWRKK